MEAYPLTVSKQYKMKFKFKKLIYLNFISAL